ncbi:hypothetical protein RRF57_010586 [Xylaria bambusicola]|uniref:Uncharacterized protein n=1 Tax=Xylaria bambusicola TaxID=326684 RepID=A0AAN7USL9_9PEZI
MLRRMNGLGKPLENEGILMLSAKLSAAGREIDAQVPADPDTRTASCKRSMASLLLRRFLLVLHRPLAGRIRENALYYHSRKMSFDSAMALLKPPLVNDTFSYIMLRGGGLFKSCLIHASLALASELLIEIEEHGSGTYRQMLVDAVREARQQWVRRIKFGDPNFRLHMKLSIVLDQAEFAGEEISQLQQQQRMAQSTKESLELCHSLIQEHVISAPTTISSEDNEWISQGLHLACSSEPNLSRECFSLNDILQIHGPDVDESVFDSNMLLL